MFAKNAKRLIMFVIRAVNANHFSISLILNT